MSKLNEFAEKLEKIKPLEFKKEFKKIINSYLGTTMTDANTSEMSIKVKDLAKKYGFSKLNFNLTYDYKMEELLFNGKDAMDKLVLDYLFL